MKTVEQILRTPYLSIDLKNVLLGYGKNHWAVDFFLEEQYRDEKRCLTNCSPEITDNPELPAKTTRPPGAIHDLLLQDISDTAIFM